MEKALVNTDLEIVDGTSSFEATTEKITKETGGSTTKIADALSKEPTLLSDKAGGLLLGIAIVPGLAIDKISQKITILDDRTPVLQIDKNTLILACQKKIDEDKVVGFSYLVPLFEHAMIVEYRFQNTIEAIGNISGLHFYFKK
jgi:hypothetical protein